MSSSLRCYVICANPRTGSWLLCHALEESGLAGVPAEYFWQGDEEFWLERWAVTDLRGYLGAFQRTATPNGVAGTKMMWGYFFDFLDKLRQLPELAGMDHDELMEEVFPGLQYLWIRRRDKVRQGISWWRAEVTGEWAVATGADANAAPPAELDLAAVKNLVDVAVAHEAAWSRYFSDRNLVPWSVDYEDLVQGPDGALNSALEYLGVHPGRPLRATPARIRPQADAKTERWVEEYHAARASGELDAIVAHALQARVEGPGSRAARDGPMM